MLQKLKNWHLSILVIIVSIFSLALIQQQVMAVWTPPPTQPGDGDPVQFLTNPLEDDLDLGGFRIFDNAIDFRLDPNADIGLKLRGTTSIEAIGKDTGVKAYVNMAYCLAGTDCTGVVGGGAGPLDTYTGIKGMTGSGVGVEGYVGQDGGIAIFGKMADATSGWAGYFGGDVNVNGNLCFDTADCIASWSDVGGTGADDGYIGDGSPDPHTAGADINMGSYDIYVSMNHGYLFGTGNSGMYWPASNSDLAFKTDNTERIRIIENGNVGIGTSAPNKKIHVYDEANAEIDIQSVAGAGNHWGIYVNNPQNNLRFWQGDNRITFTDSGELIIADHDTPFATLSIDKGVDPASFEMRGASGKNFKISLNADPYTTFYSAAYYKFIQDGIPAFNLSYFGSSINSELSVNSLDDPFYSLDVDGGANSAIVNINDVTDPVPVWTGLRLERDNSEKWFVGLDNTNDNNLLFRRNAAETIMTIADNGNVAIGAIATPGTKLEVDGNVIAAEPTLGAHLATKNYVDANAGGSDGYIGNIGPHTAGGLLTMNGNNINLAGSFISLDGTDAGLSIGAGNNVLMSSDLRIADDLRWQGELEPDGATCAPGEILKKVSSNNWDCAVDETGAGGGDTDWVEGAGVVYNLNDNIGIGTAIPNYSLDTTGDIFTSTHLLSDAWYGTTGNGGVAQDLWIGDANDTVQIQGSLAVTGNASAADPTQNQHLATKAYVDAQAGGSRAMYYHTGSDEEYDGTNVDTACDVGYHVCIANEWVGAKYDTSKINGGYEPELTDSAWFVASGGSDCSNWSSNNPVYEAATVKFDSNGTAIEQAGWYHNKESCDTVNPVLCCND